MKHPLPVRIPLSGRGALRFAALLLTAVLLLISIFAVACTDGTSEDDRYAAITSGSFLFDEENAARNVVEVAANTSWQVVWTPEDAAVSVSPASGSGDGRFTLMSMPEGTTIRLGVQAGGGGDARDAALRSGRSRNARRHRGEQRPVGRLLRCGAPLLARFGRGRRGDPHRGGPGRYRMRAGGDGGRGPRGRDRPRDGASRRRAAAGHLRTRLRRRALLVGLGQSGHVVADALRHRGRGGAVCGLQRADRQQLRLGGTLFGGIGRQLRPDVLQPRHGLLHGRRHRAAGRRDRLYALVRRSSRPTT